MSLIVLSLVAIFVGSPLNGLSPSFTAVSEDFGYDELTRDLYFASYISLSMMSGQILGSLIGGYCADVFNRKFILVTTLISAGFANILFGLPQSLVMFLLLRVCMGLVQGLTIPVLFSLIGDIYQAEKRVMASAAVSSCLGGGLLLGQLFCGMIYQYYDWRTPFLLLGIVGILLSAIVQKLLEEPNRGGNEQNNEEKVVFDRIHYLAMYRSIFNPTYLLMLIQSVPGTIPWGILSTHLQDLLTNDYNISVSQATMLIGVFGLGGALGGIISGLFGGYLYALNRTYLPFFMGSTCAAASVLLQNLLHSKINMDNELNSVVPILLVSGAFAAVSGTNIRTVIINVTAPELRGTAIGILNVLGCFGRGIGPSMTGLYMMYTKIGRVEAVRSCLYLWILSGSILCCGGLTIAKDEDKARGILKKFAPLLDDVETSK